MFCLQDIHISYKNERAFLKDWEGEAYISSISSESRGVAILFKRNLDFKIIKQEKDDEGNLLILEIQIQTFSFVLAVVYGPNNDSPAFYSSLKDKLFQTNGSPIICCGVWSLVLDAYSYLRENTFREEMELKK